MNLNLRMTLYKFQAWYILAKYRFKHWLFLWVQDDEGDIGVRIFGVITLLKYKEHTQVYWLRKLDDAPKYVREEGLTQSIKV